MKLFFLKFGAFLLCFICLDQIFGFAIKKIYNQVKSGTIFTTNYAFRQSNEDILIFGASEVAHSLNSIQIADSLNMTCYNLGMDGQNILYSYALLKEVLNRHKPKIVIVSSIILHEDEKTSLAPLFPYYGNYQSVKNIILDSEPNEKYKLLIKGYAYNSLLLKIIQGNLIAEPNTNGYIPLYEVNKNLKLTTTPFKIRPTDKTLKYFEKFLQFCLTSNCKVFVISTPRYVEKIDTVEDLKIRTLLEKYSIEYFNFTTDTLFINHPFLFRDGAHLNHNGAIIFTNLIIDKIKHEKQFENRSAGY